MDDNTIFKPQPNIGVEATQPEVLVNNPITASPPQALPSEPPPSPIFKIIKIILGIVIVLAMSFVILKFVLPRFFPSAVSKTTLTYWGLWEDSPQMIPIISDFERDNPSIKIEYSKQDIKQYRERLMTRTNGGNGPDIFRFHNSWMPMLLDILLPLPNSVISKEDFYKNYYPVAKNDLIRNGAIYGIPLQIDTLNLYVNKDLFQSAGLNPPTTWIEFENYSRQLTVKDADGNIKTAGAAMGTFDNITHAPSIVSMLLVQNGVNLNDISSNSQAASDALKFYASFSMSSGSVWDNNFDQSIKVFSSGSLAMYFGYSFDFFTIKAINPDLSFDIVPVPNLSGQNTTIANYWVEGVSMKSKHQKEALLFMKYLTQKEVEQKLFAEESKTRNFGEPYARVDLADSLKNSIVYPFVASAPTAVSSFFVDGTYDDGINAKMNTYLSNAINSILQGTSPESAAETLSQGVSQVLGQYGQ
ncbi:MAG: sugar ABC transporter substrate-binding protein [bacterium]|nr:sugar ABC transporter substrate-binding protein [bacterium]